MFCRQSTFLRMKCNPLYETHSWLWHFWISPPCAKHNLKAITRLLSICLPPNFRKYSLLFGMSEKPKVSRTRTTSTVRPIQYKICSLNRAQVVAEEAATIRRSVARNPSSISQSTSKRQSAWNSLAVEKRLVSLKDMILCWTWFWITQSNIYATQMNLLNWRRKLAAWGWLCAAAPPSFWSAPKTVWNPYRTLSLPRTIETWNSLSMNTCKNVLLFF